MPDPVEVNFNVDIGQGSGLTQIVSSVQQIVQQFQGIAQLRPQFSGRVTAQMGSPAQMQAAQQQIQSMTQVMQNLGYQMRGMRTQVGPGGQVAFAPQFGQQQQQQGGGAGQVLQQGLSRILPGGQLGMAFKNLGLLGGIATAAVGALAFIKGIFQNSVILSTFSRSFMKVFGLMADMIMMPFMPLMNRVLIWVIQVGFPLARGFSKLIDMAGGIESVMSSFFRFGPTGGFGDIFRKIFQSQLQEMGGISSIFSGIGDFFGGLFERLREMLQIPELPSFSVITEAIQETFNTLTQGLQDLVPDSVQNIVSKVTEWISNLFKNVIDNILGFIPDKIRTFASDLFTELRESVQGIFSFSPKNLIPQPPSLIQSATEKVGGFLGFGGQERGSSDNSTNNYTFNFSGPVSADEVVDRFSQNARFKDTMGFGFSDIIINKSSN